MGIRWTSFVILALFVALAGAAAAEPHGWAGVAVQSVTPELADRLGLGWSKGAEVTRVTGGGPAEQAGLQAGDLILRVDGFVLKDADAFADLVSSRAPGTTLALLVRRGSQEVPVSLQLRERPDGVNRTLPVAEKDAGPAPAPPPSRTASAGAGPLGIGLVPFTDPNHKDTALQFGYKMMGERKEVDRVYAIGTPDDCWRVLESLRREGRKVGFILIAGHSSFDLPRVDLASGTLYNDDVDLVKLHDELAPYLKGWTINLERGTPPDVALDKIQEIVKKIERLQAISEVCVPDARIALWACSNGRTEEGAHYCRALGNVLAGRYGGRLMASEIDIGMREILTPWDMWVWLCSPGVAVGDFAVKHKARFFDIPARGADSSFEVTSATAAPGDKPGEVEVRLAVRGTGGPPGPMALDATLTTIPSKASTGASGTLSGPSSEGVLVGRLRDVKPGDVCYFMVHGADGGPRVGKVALNIRPVRTIEIVATAGANSISTSNGSPTQGFGQSENSDVWIPFNFQTPGGKVRAARITFEVRPLGGLTNTDCFYLKAPSMPEAAMVWSGFNNLPEKQWSTVTFEVTDEAVLKALCQGGLLEGLVQDDSNVNWVKLLVAVEE